MAQPPILKTSKSFEREAIREADPGTLHLRGGAARVHGPDGGRGNPVVVMKNIVKAQAFRFWIAVMMLASSAIVLEAGQRWR